jgi:lysosomal acid lipase/cholesteryl ester hydrolase
MFLEFIKIIYDYFLSLNIFNFLFFRYDIEEYTVTTEDNYKLQLFRILLKNKNSLESEYTKNTYNNEIQHTQNFIQNEEIKVTEERKEIDQEKENEYQPVETTNKVNSSRLNTKESTGKKTQGKQAVYFQHGLFDSSDGWICNYEKNCLPFIMLKRGFDVWVGNSRGNKHSKLLEQENGRDVSKENSQFWDYSLHDMGMYDLPGNIEKILSINTSSDKVIYFGHSQGGASVLAGMSEKLDYFKSKLKAVVLLAPASRVDSYDSHFLTFIRDIELDLKLKNHSIHEILAHDPNLHNISVKVAKLYPTLHYAMLELTSDEQSWMNCPERIKVYMSHYPSGSSIKSLTHFRQIIDAKSFQHFDYGIEENIIRYGSPLPKAYDVAAIDGIPIILCGGLNDKLTHINDIRWLKSQLENKSLFSYYEFDHMGHASFLINNDITWFNFILRDIYKIMEGDLKSEFSTKNRGSKRNHEGVIRKSSMVKK